jgi:hypothetical protein
MDHEPECLKPFARLLPASAVPQIFPPPAVDFGVKGGDVIYVGQSMLFATAAATLRA